MFNIFLKSWLEIEYQYCYYYVILNKILQK